MSFWSLKNTLTVEQRRIFVETAKEREGKAPLSDKKYTTRDFGNIYRMIYQKKQSSRQQIAEQLGISLPTVTQNLKLLNESGLICKGGVFQSTGGRKANSFQFVPDARYALGIDITQNHLSIVLINLNLDLIDSRRMRRAFEDTGSYYQSLAAEVEAFLKERDLDMEKLLGVGISLPAIIEEDQKTISYATVIQISGSIYEHIRTYLPYPFLLFNDASSAGLAESWLLKSSNPIVYLLLSNSVGGSLTIEGKISKGSMRVRRSLAICASCRMESAATAAAMAVWTHTAPQKTCRILQTAIWKCFLISSPPATWATAGFLTNIWTSWR